MTDRDKSSKKNDAGEGDALEALAACRKASIDLGAAYGYNTAVYRQTTELQECIDRIAGILTGDTRHFWSKAHGTPGPRFEHAPWRDLVKKLED